MSISFIELHRLVLPQTKQRISLIDPQSKRGEVVEMIAVCLRTGAGLTSLGFTCATSGAAAIRSLIEKDFAPLLTGANPLDPERLLMRAQAQFRTAGWHGLVARAWAAIDIALWDLKAKIANLPLYQLFGGARSSASVYLSDVASSGHDPAQTLAAAKPLIEEGVLGLYVEVGGGNIQLDADRVQQIRDGVGDNAWLGIAVEGRYDLGTAMAMAHFYEEDVGIDRYDTPLPADDAAGYQRLAERMEVPLALGDSFDRRDDFRRTLERGDVRVIRPDVLRLGGITPFLKIAALAEAYPVTVTPYRLPEIGVHLACGLPNVDAVEFVSTLSSAFLEPLQIKNGKLAPGVKPGHGFELNPDVLQRYAVSS